MDRESAFGLVLSEAFSPDGIAVMMGTGDEPGTKRVDQLIVALNFLADELADEDVFARDFVSAIVFFASEAVERIGGEQGTELSIAARMLAENWNNWPEGSRYEFATPPVNGEVIVDAFAGYLVGDITYCRLTLGDECFPVRVTQLTRRFLTAEPLNPNHLAGLNVDPSSKSNLHFFHPRLSPGARFGGEDERLVNSGRESGPELRLLPLHYATTTHASIREKHAADPHGWPLPTGKVFENWFKSD